MCKLGDSTDWLTGQQPKQTTDLSNAWVGTLDVPGRKVQPAASVGGDGGTVLPHGASALAATPATLELPVRPQTHATTVPLSAALVEVHWGMTQSQGQLKYRFTRQHWFVYHRLWKQRKTKKYSVKSQQNRDQQGSAIAINQNVQI